MWHDLIPLTLALDNFLCAEFAFFQCLPLDFEHLIKIVEKNKSKSYKPWNHLWLKLKLLFCHFELCSNFMLFHCSNLQISNRLSCFYKNHSLMFWPPLLFSPSWLFLYYATNIFRFSLFAVFNWLGKTENFRQKFTMHDSAICVREYLQAGISLFQNLWIMFLSNWSTRSL